MSNPTVLIGFAEALAAPEVTWSLADAGFKVAAFARRGRGSALRYSHHLECYEICAPETNLKTALSDLRSLIDCLALGANGTHRILFPLDDKAVWLCNALQPGSGWLCAGPTDACASLALDKYLQTEAARIAGFYVPKTLLAHTVNDVFNFSVAASFPIIMKPAQCVSIKEGRVSPSRKWICADSRELEKAVAEWGETVPLLLQPFLDGTGEGIFGLATPDGIRAWSAHRRVRMMNPQGSGSSACTSSPVPEELKPKVEALINNAGWRGLFMIELLRDNSGTAWFVELNGRPWGSMALSRRQGLEYPAWQVKQIIDYKSCLETESRKLRTIVCRNVGREIMHLLFVLKGPKSKALNRWPTLWSTITETIRIRPHDTLYNWRRDDWKVFFADCYYTIHDNVCKGRN